MVCFDFDPDRDSMIRLFPRITSFLTSISKKCVIRGNYRKTSMGPVERMHGGLLQTRLSGMTQMAYLFALFHGVRGDCLPGRRRIVHAMALVLRWLSARNPAAEVERDGGWLRDSVRWPPSACLLRADPAGDRADDHECGSRPEDRAGRRCQDDRGGDRRQDWRRV